MARTRRGRLRQVEAWLRAGYPTAYPVVVRVCDVPRDKENPGRSDCGLSGKRLVIRIHKNLTWGTAIDHLLHEWGHAVTWKSKDPLPHGPEFAAAYGKIYCDWFDRGGWKESREF